MNKFGGSNIKIGDAKHTQAPLQFPQFYYSYVKYYIISKILLWELSMNHECIIDATHLQ